MIRLLHLSDLHIHGSFRKNQELIKRMRYIREKYPNHDRIITGDVTDDGSKDQYTNAIHILMSGGNYACPGNHDYGYLGNLYDKKRALRFDSYLPQQVGRYLRLLPRPMVDVMSKGDTRVVLVGLDSNLKTRQPFDFACGKIGWLQRVLLKRVLNKVKRKWPNCVRIVYFHHHPFQRGPWTGMKDAKKLMTVLCDRSEVVLFGHKHQAEIYNQAKPGRPWCAAGKLDECSEVTEINIDGNEVWCNQVPVV